MTRASRSIRQILRAERDDALWSAVKSLPSECQRVLRVMLDEPAPTYAQAAARLGIPVGL